MDRRWDLRCSGVLLDMDGTLVDSTAVVDSILAEFAFEYGLDSEHVAANAHGLQTIDQVRMFLPHLSDAEHLRIEQWIDQLETIRTEGIREVPGAKNFLDRLEQARIPYAVVTSASREVAEARLTAAGLPVPDRMITADHTHDGKPSPAPYLAGAALLGLDASQCVAFEDAEAGLRSAVAAGASTVVVGHHRSDLANSLPRIASFAHISLLSTPAGHTLQYA